jgi:carboxylesterase
MSFSDLSRPWRSAPHSTGPGSPGLLLCHGFTSTPSSVRPWAEHHAAHGADVRVPLLPGHGTCWQDMARSTWQDWYGHVRDQALELQEEHGTIAVGGLSMGGGLALRLAQDPATGPGIGAVVLVNATAVPDPSWYPAPLLAPLVRSIPAIGGDIALPGHKEECYDRTPLRSVGQMRRLVSRVHRDLARITAPVLVATSPRDHTVRPRNSDVIAAGVHGPVERLRLERSFHVATLDHDAELLFDTSADFLRRRMPRP